MQCHSPSVSIPYCPLNFDKSSFFGGGANPAAFLALLSRLSRAHGCGVHTPCVDLSFMVALCWGGFVVGYWHAGSRLLTAPAWHTASPALPLPRSRVDLGPTNWPVVAVYFPPSCVRPATSHPWHASLPRLRGSAASDFLFLRGMRPGVVSGLRRKELHRSS